MSLLCYTYNRHADAPKITIVTVVLNNVQHVALTIKSVLDQTYTNKEYIIIDGGSTDGTLSEINRYRMLVHKIVSESDRGVYDAMNKALKIASGEWIVFMNSGDQFFENDTLANVFSKRYRCDTAVIFGDSKVLYPSGKMRLRQAGSAERLWQGSQFSHQSSFSRLGFHARNEFLLSDGIAADFGFFYRAWIDGVTFERLNYPVSIVRSGGISDVRRLEAIRQWSTIVRPSLKSSFYFRYRTLRELVSSLVKQGLYRLGVR